MQARLDDPPPNPPVPKAQSVGMQMAITSEIVSFMLDAEEHLFGEAKRQGWVPRDRTPLKKELTGLIRGDRGREPRRQ